MWARQGRRVENSRFHELLKTLLNRGIEFVVVGGVAAVLRGAPVGTFDLDVAHATTVENATRILAALEELDARYRLQPERQVSSVKNAQLTGLRLLRLALGAARRIKTLPARNAAWPATAKSKRPPRVVYPLTLCDTHWPPLPS